MAGAALAVLGALLCALAVQLHSFPLLLAGSVLGGSEVAISPPPAPCSPHNYAAPHAARPMRAFTGVSCRRQGGFGGFLRFAASEVVQVKYPPPRLGTQFDLGPQYRQPTGMHPTTKCTFATKRRVLSQA